VKRVKETAPRWRQPVGPLRLGISSCLIGQKVRWDGNHKRDAFLVETLGSHVCWVPVCPEMESGMPVPRPPVRLMQTRGGVRLMESEGETDHTRSMTAWSRDRLDALEAMSLCGYVLKKDSPSCGMERVKVWRPGGTAVREGRGLFASALMERMPALPVEEEGRLQDRRLRENFVERIFAFHRLKALFAPGWSRGDLVAFHTAHKLQLLSHSETAHRSLGRLVARSKEIPRPVLQSRYEGLFMEALSRPATIRRHANVLQHMVGHFRERLDPERRASLATSVEDYRAGLVPLVVPLTLIAHHARALRVAYLAGQIYLQPHPRELMLRNHV
jgi:uncharacterized protein YbgA (DUF1722 family)/uncharacterized protein YbbK (DUF523 family)